MFKSSIKKVFLFYNMVIVGLRPVDPTRKTESQCSSEYLFI